MTSDEILQEAATAISKNDLSGVKAPLSMQQMPGDASTRRYFRVRAKSESWVLMAMEPYEPAKNNFLLVQAVLARAHVAVPKVVAQDPQGGFLLLQDLGDATMLHTLEASMAPEREISFFRRAIDLMVDIHGVKPTPAEQANVRGFSLAFDEEILNWEVNFTQEHFLKNYLKREIPSNELELIRQGFADINRRIAREPRVFTHRDYHSRNIMTLEENYYAIDFQDARMGARQYDLASLLRDSYYQLSEEKVYALLEYYLERAEARHGVAFDRAQFREVFDLMSIQRNWKAIGSFASFYVRRDNARYLRFIGNTFENVRRNLVKFPEYAKLHQLLFQWYYF